MSIDNGIGLGPSSSRSSSVAPTKPFLLEEDLVSNSSESSLSRASSLGRVTLLGPGKVSEGFSLTKRVQKWQPKASLGSLAQKVAFAFARVADLFYKLGSGILGKVYQELPLAHDYLVKDLKGQIKHLKEEIERGVKHLQVRNRKADIWLARRVLSLFKEREKLLERLSKRGDFTFFSMSLETMLLASVQEPKKLAPLRAKIAFLERAQAKRASKKASLQR